MEHLKADQKENSFDEWPETNGVGGNESQFGLIHGDSVGEDEANRLKDLGLATEVRDQDDLERDVNRQADALLTEQANERDIKRMDKTKADKEYGVSLHHYDST